MENGLKDRVSKAWRRTSKAKMVVLVHYVFPADALLIAFDVHLTAFETIRCPLPTFEATLHMHEDLHPIW